MAQEAVDAQIAISEDEHVQLFTNRREKSRRVKSSC